MHRLLLRSNSGLISLLFCAAFCGCGSAPSRIGESEVVAVHRDAQAWNDFMPGSAPKCHALMTVSLRNLTRDDIVLRSAEGTLVDTRGETPLRRFPAAMVYNDVETPEVRLAPGMELELTFRTPMGIPPIDARRYGNVRFIIRAETSLGRPIALRSRPLELFATQ